MSRISKLLSLFVSKSLDEIQDVLQAIFGVSLTRRKKQKWVWTAKIHSIMNKIRIIKDITKVPSMGRNEMDTPTMMVGSSETPSLVTPSMQRDVGVRRHGISRVSVSKSKAKVRGEKY